MNTKQEFPTKSAMGEQERADPEGAAERNRLRQGLRNKMVVAKGRTGKFEDGVQKHVQNLEQKLTKVA